MTSDGRLEIGECYFFFNFVISIHVSVCCSSASCCTDPVPHRQLVLGLVQNRNNGAKRKEEASVQYLHCECRTWFGGAFLS